VLDGGQVKIDDLNAVGGKSGAGGTLEVDARGDVVLESIDLSGGDGDGSLLVLTDGNVTLANIFADGGGIDGAGGSIEVAADGDVSVTGSIKARGGDGLNNGGDGGVVEITSGPFTDFSGTVQEVYRDKGKVKVEVSLFGRPTSVELDFTQLKGY